MSVMLIHPQGNRSVSLVNIVTQCSLFATTPSLLPGPYTVKSSVSLADLDEFVNALGQEAIAVNRNNYIGLFRLSLEFGFHALSAQVTEFRPDVLLTEFTDVLARLSGLERTNEVLQQTVHTLEGANTQLEQRVQSLAAGQTPAPARPLAPPEPVLDSVIVRKFPDVLSQFRGKSFHLLWRATRDGFNGEDFHRLCDGHPNTVTFIVDVGGNIFGGFTPIAWERGGSSGYYKPDPSGRSFLFTLKNPADTDPMVFSLKVPSQAIYIYPSHGPHFGNDDIYVANNSNGNTNGYNRLGWSYENHSGRDGNTVFTGALHWRAKDIEVFEIALS
jgi:hypothetical protein